LTKETPQTMLYIEGRKNPKDIPWDDLMVQMEHQVQLGNTVFLKWTCDGCGQRATSNQENSAHKFMLHEDCGAITHVEKKGGGYSVLMHNKTLEEVIEYIQPKRK